LNEFDFAKISLSLERDLVPAENPIDAYRDIKALLERMVTEFQAGKPSQIANTLAKSSPNTSAAKPKESLTVGHNQVVSPRPAVSKPPSLTVETVREHLAKWLPGLEILDGFDGFSVKPKRFLGEVWSEVNEVMRLLGGKWQKGLKSTDGAWRIPK
jgi:hypothetical protein